VIPTGFYIKSIRFINASDVHMTGYIWQRYPKETLKIDRGFIFPDAVNESNNSITEVYTSKLGGS